MYKYYLMILLTLAINSWVILTINA